MLLPDTHTILWLLESPEKIPNKSLSQLQDPEVIRYLSPIIVWEIATKISLRKLKVKRKLADMIAICLAELRFVPLPITHAHSLMIEALPLVHGDPFDRMLIAQAKTENLKIVTKDENIEQYPVKTLWA